MRTLAGSEVVLDPMHLLIKAVFAGRKREPRNQLLYKNTDPLSLTSATPKSNRSYTIYASKGLIVVSF